jgi:glycosyltransferase involved in cell wall biosynthesis
MTAPVVSVVIPVHNASDTLIEQLEALRAGGFESQPAEIVVVDNRSSDGSADIATRWAADHSIDLRVVEANERAGEPHARNVGLAAARGRHILYCDADDQVAADWVSSLAAALETYHYATGPIDMAKLNPSWIANTRGRSVVEGRSTMYDLVPYAHGCNMGFRRETLVALGGFDESYLAGCDLDIAIRMWESGHDLRFCDEATVHYRLRPSLRTTYRQGVFYGRYRVRIRRRLAPVASLPEVDPRNRRRLLWLARKLPIALVHRPTRARWVWVLGQRVGERRGGQEFAATDPAAHAPHLAHAGV